MRWLGYFFAIVRFLLLVISMIILLMVFFILLPFLKNNNNWKYVIRNLWIRSAIFILGLKITRRNTPYSGPAIFVCNHRSMTDPVIALRYFYAYVVAKMEVQSYPVLGRGAAVTGVIYVDRSNPESRKKTRKKMENRLDAGDSILIFPEGTVKSSHMTGQFKIGSFDISSNNNIPIVPISLDYKNRERDYWRPNEPLYKHFLDKFSKLFTHAYISFGEPIFNKNSWDLLEQTQKYIDDRIAEVHPNPANFQDENQEKLN